MAQLLELKSILDAMFKMADDIVLTSFLSTFIGLII